MDYLFLVIILLANLHTVFLQQFRRVCYHTNWSQYRPGRGRFTPEDIPVHLCTHLIYAFATMEGNHLKAFEWNDDNMTGKKGMYQRFIELKKRNPSLKMLLGVGGWNFGTRKMTAMLKTKPNQDAFVRHSISFLRKRGFDGLDLDFEYPAGRGSPPDDRWRYAFLVKQLRKAFMLESLASHRAPLLLTAAVPAGKDNIDAGYDVPVLASHLDFLNVMTYDFHGKWEKTTGHNSPLFARKQETGSTRFLNLEFAAEYWVQLGAPPEKLNIGMPLYGRSFTLKDRTQHQLGAPIKDGGTPGKYTREKGILAYYEVCSMLGRGAQRFWNDEHQVPYAVMADQWVGYDDPESLTLKTKWIQDHGYGGIMVWAIDLDDFTGSCGGPRYPLLTAINQQGGPPTGSGTRSGSYSPQVFPQPGPINNAIRPVPPNPLQPPSPPYIPVNRPVIPEGQPSLSQRPPFRHFQNKHTPRPPQYYVYWQKTGQVQRVLPWTTLPPTLVRSIVGKARPQRAIRPRPPQDTERVSNCDGKADGFYPHLIFCERFFQCHAGKKFEQSCPPGTKFNTQHNVCDYQSHHQCISLNNPKFELASANSGEINNGLSGPSRDPQPGKEVLSQLSSYPQLLTNSNTGNVPNTDDSQNPSNYFPSQRQFFPYNYMGLDDIANYYSYMQRWYNNRQQGKSSSRPRDLRQPIIDPVPSNFHSRFQERVWSDPNQDSSRQAHHPYLVQEK